MTKVRIGKILRGQGQRSKSNLKVKFQGQKVAGQFYEIFGEGCT